MVFKKRKCDATQNKDDNSQINSNIEILISNTIHTVMMWSRIDENNWINCHGNSILSMKKTIEKNR